MRNPRGQQSFPAGYYTAPAVGSRGSGGIGFRNRTHSSRSGASSYSRGSSSAGGSGPPRMRHWGSSLSVDDAGAGAGADVAELRSRTLRPPTPSDRATPARDSVVRTSHLRNWLPKTGLQERARQPALAEYLEKPRLVSTLGCVERRAGAHAVPGNRQPVHRNLRLAGFLDDPAYGSDGELIPDVLRQYYLDTYLDTYEFEYLKNFGDADLEQEDGREDAGAAAGTTMQHHRGM